MTSYPVKETIVAANFAIVDKFIKIGTYPRLDVAMDNTSIVNILNSESNLNEPIKDEKLAEQSGDVVLSLFCDHHGEVAFIAPFHDDLQMFPVCNIYIQSSVTLKSI